MNSIEITTWLQPDCTLGRLTYGEFKCFTLELPWKDNRNDVSCIPAGSYRATKYWSPGKKQQVLLLHDVPGRSLVEIHSGNYTRQIEGCILVGKGITYLDDDDIPDVTSSKVTLAALLAVAPEAVNVEIIRCRSAIFPHEIKPTD